MVNRVKWASGVCLDCRRQVAGSSLRRNGWSIRSLSTVQNILPPSQPPPPPPPDRLDPRTVTRPREERKLLRSRVFPIGSRRRRAALKSSQNIPFEQLPYQCFQEARKILQDDRQEKLKLIELERGRIQRLLEQPTNDATSASRKEIRLSSMRRHLEWLKIQADINDPLVKKKFEDGQGDMSRPIYRYLAERKWRSHKALIIEQRVSQMSLVPDILPSISITADVSLLFHGTKNAEKMVVPRSTRVGHRVAVQPGEFVASKVSEDLPDLRIHVFDKGVRNVTVAVVDPDVPNVSTDSFDNRCHFLAANIPISPTSTNVSLKKLKDDSQVILPWLPPYAQKGSPYHRLAVLIFQQPEGVQIDIQQAKDKYKSDGFTTRSFADRYRLRTIGAHLFRTQHDQWTDELMNKLGVEGVGEELRRKRVLPLPYKKKDPERFR